MSFCDKWFSSLFRLFPGAEPPVLSIDSRQYAVTIHFEKRTPENYLAAAYQKVCEIHEQRGPGTILVFLTGRLEVGGFFC